MNGHKEAQKAQKQVFETVKKCPRITRMTQMGVLFIRVICVIRGPNNLAAALFQSLFAEDGSFTRRISTSATTCPRNIFLCLLGLFVAIPRPAFRPTPL
ncbi:hypothetical protein CfE428DRAFT_3203 [Chthoniobacter flavus Ellin428]|uniref:Uncharacterized protein n=1 Tax=Chthoniobacter flavus Ellin428 TaxID=497964 RepID=B4D2R5_9BACT|nr:hypothetical protein CfE428DRAFT_3203 [Chthoniobacter flavus Ellin428]TCO86790.1 hypothetical protein EV701_1265 [Chthoniobacter flavus]